MLLRLACGRGPRRLAAATALIVVFVLVRGQAAERARPEWGRLVGHVRLGVRPSPRPLSTDAYSRQISAPASPANELTNVLVWIKDAPRGAAPTPTAAASFASVARCSSHTSWPSPPDRRWRSRTTIFSFTTSSRCRVPGTFDLGRYPQGDTRVRRFDKAGVVKVYCHLHSHMSAIIAVFDHPWFAQVGADGNFEIDRVPAGTLSPDRMARARGEHRSFSDDRARRHHAGRAAGSNRAMSAASPAARSPRFVVRVLAASFATVVVVLAAVFTVLMLHTRTLVRRSVVDNLEAGQRLLALFERERQHEAALQATVLTESPPLKAALDTYQSESMLNDERGGTQASATVEHEVTKLAGLLQSDIVAVVGVDGRVIASAGPRAAAWRPRQDVRLGESAASAAFETVVTLGGQTFRTTVAPMQLGGSWIGDLIVGTGIDEHYAAQLSNVARTSVAVVADGRVIASTLASGPRASFETQARAGLEDAGVLTLGEETFAYRRLQQIGPTAFYAMDSTTAASDRVSRDALPKLAAIAFGGVVLCLLASVRLARTVSAPIDHLSRELSLMADAHETGRLTPPKRTSHEIDTLTATFNRLIQSLAAARAETDAAYVGAIRALAAALDARDAYTAGHSERVSALSLAIGEQMGLGAKDLEVLRLGALLHDIGKIGIGDDILGKPGPLTPDEFEVIKTHPSLGAQILRSVPFLEPHLAIVELHHEQPDGRGYPHGLRGDEIPLLARIVHVADAFDAMTTARAYRAGRPAAEALAVLWRHAGSQFDMQAVQSLSATLPAILRDMTAAGDERRPAEVVRFTRRAAEA